jgi:hypothetical protein
VDSYEAKTLSTGDYSSSSFWKGILPPYRETIDIDDNSIASRDSFHSIEDDGEREGNQSIQDDMILSDSIVNLNIYLLTCFFLSDSRSGKFNILVHLTARARLTSPLKHL